MYIDPRIAIEKGWVRGIKNFDVQVQPNAIDFTLDKVFTIMDEPFYISDTVKRPRSTIPHAPIHNANFDDHFWRLNPHAVYDGMSDMYVELPEGVAAELIIRSSLNRNGVFITSGLYDQGFRGHVGFVLHNRSGGPANIAIGTRIGQIKFIAAGSSGELYAGSYNHAEGKYKQ